MTKKEPSEKFLNRNHEIWTPFGVVEATNRQIGATVLSVGALLGTVEGLTISTTDNIIEYVDSIDSKSGESNASQIPTYSVHETEQLFEHAFDNPHILNATNTNEVVVDDQAGPGLRTIIDLAVDAPLTEKAKNSKIDFTVNFPKAKEVITYADGTKIMGDIKSDPNGSNLELLVDTNLLTKHGDQATADVYENLTSDPLENKDKSEVHTSVYAGSVVIDADHGNITSLNLIYNDKAPKTQSTIVK